MIKGWGGAVEAVERGNIGCEEWEGVGFGEGGGW